MDEQRRRRRPRPEASNRQENTPEKQPENKPERAQKKTDDAGRKRARRKQTPKIEKQIGKINPGLLRGIAAGALIVIGLCFIGNALRVMERTKRTQAISDSLVVMREEGMSATPAPQTDAQPENHMAQPDAQPDSEPGTTGEKAEATEAPYTATEAPKATSTPAPNETMPETFHACGGEMLSEMKALYARNDELTGWLSIEGVLDLPVVYVDNEFYLTHDFDGNENTAGTLFLDVSHPFVETTQNLLIHGHNMRDGTMFGRLLQYETNIDFLRAHPIIEFDSLWNREYYVVFSVMHTSLDVNSAAYVDYYAHPRFATAEDCAAYLSVVKEASIYEIPVDAQPSDALLTLSTCLDEDRLVILARRMREGELAQLLRGSVYKSVRK